MSRTTIPVRTVAAIWVRAGGRCEYPGCNALLYRDDLTNKDVNRSYIAHIVADAPDGPRGDAALSPKLAEELSNLMLLCDTHHRLIDREDVDGHPVELLRQYKRDHEDRIELVTSIAPNLRTHVVILQANIGNQKTEIGADDVRRAVLPARYPARDVVRIDLTGTSHHERDPGYWEATADEMKHQVEARLRWNDEARRREHLSIFALGPIPLLMAFGRALGDKVPADVFQLHRDPPSWPWPPGTTNPLEFKSLLRAEPAGGTKAVAVSIGVSSAVPPNAVAAAMSGDYAFYEMTVESPSLTAVRAAADVTRFATVWHALIEQIRHHHGADCTIHVFPALPVSLAVQAGRALQPKVHPKILIYDYNSSFGGFRHALTL